MTEHHAVVVVGTGFGGLCTAIKLQEAGWHDVVLLERADDVGGTWRDNTYPGAACDVPSHLYSFSFALNPNWSRSFGTQPEIQQYLRRVARDSGVLEKVRFRTELLSADWDPGAQRWRITTSAGDLTADFLVTASGALSEPSTPDLPGLESFGGRVFHSARWDHTWTPQGKRVAAIGTGASAIQFVPELQRDVDHLTLFQRTAPWVLPRVDRSISPAERRLYRRFPGLQRLVRALLYWGRESHLIGFRYHRGLLRLGERIARKQLEQQVRDPQLRDRLTPRFDLGCKRVLLSSSYYPALTRPNVSVVTDRIVEVVPEGVVSEDGAGTRIVHHVDTIVFGTGFQVTRQPIAERVSVDGVTLAKRWDEHGVQALRGTTVAGMPNFFMVVGPNTGLGHNSMVLMIEAQVGYLVQALDATRRGGWAVIEPRAEVQEAYNRSLQRSLSKTVWETGGGSSWYQDEHGRNVTLWPTFSWRFMQEMRRFDATEYVVQPRRRAAPAAAQAS